jgi:hypothetical protein
MPALGFFETITHSLTSGKGQFRLILQPAMAVLLGVRMGIADAKRGDEPFIARLVHTKPRWPLVKQSIARAAVPLVVAVVIDSILQFLTQRYVRPLAAVVVGAILVWLPFAITRGLSNRAWRRHQPAHPAGAT